MKKIFTSLMLLLTVVALVFTLSACNNENNDETRAPKDELDYTECEHKEWKLIGSLEATCEDAGYTRLECKSCGKTETNDIPQKPCDYEVNWTWGDSVWTTIVDFTCPRTNAHNQRKIAFIFESAVIKEATCQEYGEVLYHAEAKDRDGKIHTAEKIKKYKVGCSMVSEIIKPETCFGTGKIIDVCQWCGKEEISTFRASHTDVKEVERYNLVDYGYCGGSLVRYECQCGYKGKEDYLHTCKNMEVLDIIVDNEGVLHQVLQICNDCGFCVTSHWKDTVWQLEGNNRMQQIRDEQGSCDGGCDWDSCAIDVKVPLGYQDLFYSQSYYCVKCDTEITLMSAINDSGVHGILCCYSDDEYAWYPKEVLEDELPE